jgi:hypothetical protein
MSKWLSLRVLTLRVAQAMVKCAKGIQVGKGTRAKSGKENHYAFCRENDWFGFFQSS